MDMQFWQMAALRTAIDIRMEHGDDAAAIREACRRASQGGTDRKFYEMVITSIIENGTIDPEKGIAIVREYFYLVNGVNS